MTSISDAEGVSHDSALRSMMAISTPVSMAPSTSAGVGVTPPEERAAETSMRSTPTFAAARISSDVPQQTSMRGVRTE